MGRQTQARRSSVASSHFGLGYSSALGTGRMICLIYFRFDNLHGSVRFQQKLSKHCPFSVRVRVQAKTKANMGPRTGLGLKPSGGHRARWSLMFWA